MRWSTREWRWLTCSLHQYETDGDGNPIVSSVPADSVAEDPELGAAHRRPPVREEPLENTGRPEWLEKISALPPRKRRTVSILIVAVLLGLEAGAFYFALGPTSQAAPKNEHTYVSHGEVWKARPDTRTAFPTYIGYPGSYKTGRPADYAEEMRPGPSCTRGGSPIATAVPGFEAQFNPFQHMGPLSPYQAASYGIDNARYLATPETRSGKCMLRQVHILHRHGARYPTAGSPTELVRALVSRNALGAQHVSFSGPLQFLNKYVYRLGEELLVAVGRDQLHHSGTKAAVDYLALAQADLNSGKPLFVRTGSQQRIVDSALAWATGFWGNSWVNKTNVEIQIEAPGFNTTLAANFACEAAKRHKKRTAHDWVQQYLSKAVERLQPHVHGAQLTPDIVYGMQQLCSYDTVAFGHSDFCTLFTEDEWRGLEYSWDLKFHELQGPSAPTGRAEGVGWLNEFISRLTGTAWNVTTQTSENATLNTQPHLFPLDRAIYADFAHDSTISTVLAAMRLRDFDRAPELNDRDRAWRTSKMVPFAARLIFELFSCPEPLPRERRRFEKTRPNSTNVQQYVRMKLNDGIVPLEQLRDCPARKDGLCPLDQFLASHADRNSQGWWDRCAT